MLRASSEMGKIILSTCASYIEYSQYVTVTLFKTSIFVCMRVLQ